MKKDFLTAIIVTIIIFSNILLGQDDSPVTLRIPSGIDIELSGEVEMELVDVEGKGGAGNRETFLKKIETRSPYTRIDKAVLDFKVIYSPTISYRFSLRFNDNGAYADKHYLLYKNMTFDWK